MPFSAVILREPHVTVVSRPSFAEPAHLRVNWTGKSTDGEQLAEFAGRLCYMSQSNPANRDTHEYIENIKKQGHGSVMEHANYSLLIEGVSRTISHELVRHRAGFTFSELSQRHVDETSVRFVIPPAIVGDDSLERHWTTQVESALSVYSSLVEQLMGRYSWINDKMQRRKLAREGAQAVLPNSTETKLLVTANARAWRTMLELRCGDDAEFEMRRLTLALIRLLQTEAPSFFSDFEIYTAADRKEAVRVLYHKV